MDFDNSLDTISPDVASQTITIGGTGSIQIPAGSTAQRPGTGVGGMMRYSTTLSLVEGYIGGAWKSLQLQSANLDALAANATTGLIAQTGTSTYSARTLSTGSSARITVTNGNGVSGNPTVDLATVVTAGTAPVITYDEYGRVTAGSSTLTTALNEASIATIASAATVNIGAAASNTVYVTGAVTITSLGTIAAGAHRRIRFGGALVLTYNATSLILPTSANITTAANDVAEFVSLGSGNWICTSYTRASGQALSGGTGAAITVQNEGVTLTSSLTSLNFTGAGVTASGTSAVTVNVPGNAPTYTNATKVGSFTSNTVTGNQSITGIGFQPKAVFFWYSEVVSVSARNELRRAFGAATSTTERWAFGETMAPSTASTNQQFKSTLCFFFNDTTNGTARLAYDFFSFDYDGFTLNLTATDGVARTVHYMAIGGDGVFAKAGYWKTDGTNASAAAANAGNQAITGLGFQPKATIFGMGNVYSATETTSGSNFYSIGWATSSTSQAVIYAAGADTPSPSPIKSGSKSNAIVVWSSTVGPNDVLSFVSNDANGFTTNWTSWSALSAYEIGYLALGGSINAAATTITEPAATGSQSVTSYSFQPTGTLFMTMFGTAATTPSPFIISGERIGFGGASDSTHQASSTWYMPDGTATTTSAITTSSTTDALIVSSTTSGTAATMSLTSNDATGFTVNWSQIDSNSDIVFALSVGGNTAISAGSPKSITIPSPTNTDNFTILYTSSSMMLSSIRSVLRGSSTPSVTFSIRYGTDRSAAGTEVVTSGITCTNTTSGLSTNTFNNGTIPANNYVWITVSAVSGTVTELNVTIV